MYRCFAVSCQCAKLLTSESLGENPSTRHPIIQYGTDPSFIKKGVGWLEWTALGIVTGAHLGTLQLLRFAQEMSVRLPFQVVVLTGAFLGMLFAFFGVQMTRRHVRLTRIKIGWIYRAEDSLGLIERPGREKGIIPANDNYLEDIPWNGLMWPRPQSTSWIILLLYLLLVVLDILAIVMTLFT